MLETEAGSKAEKPQSKQSLQGDGDFISVAIKRPLLSAEPDHGEIKENPLSLNSSAEVCVAIEDNAIDDAFMAYLRKHKIKSIFASVVANVFTVNSYVSILYFANCVRRFPTIQHVVYEALKKIIYYICTMHEEVIKAISLEAATVGTEATSFTSAYMVSASALLVLLLTYQALKYPFMRSKKNAFKKTLEELGLDPKICSLYADLSSEQIFALTVLVHSKIDTEKELLSSLLSVYFEDLSGEKGKQFSRRVEQHRLKAKIIDSLSIKPSRWQTFVANSEWYETEIARYRIPIASLCAIPGVVLMVLKSLKLGGDITTLVTDQGPVVDQANNESLEIYPWMTASFPVIFFQATAMLFYLATRLPYFGRLATGFYHKVHAPIEKWAKDAERWLYYDLGREVVMVAAIPAIVTYAGIKSIDFADRYAATVGCGSVGKVFKSIVLDQADASGKCMTASRANLMALLVGDTEFDKFYLFYALLLVTYYPVMALIQKFSSLKEWLSKEKAQKIYDEFKKINKNSFYVAGGVTFIAAWVAFFIGRQFANHVPEEGLQVAYDINDYIHPNMTIPTGPIDNSTVPVILHEICPYADLGKIIADATKDLPIPHNITELEKIILSMNGTFPHITWPSIPIKIINNSTIVATLAEACPSYGLMSLFFLNLVGAAVDCNPLVEYRTLATFITLFWMSISLVGGGSLSLASAGQLLWWGVNTIKNGWYGAALQPAPTQAPQSDPHPSAEASNLRSPFLPSQNENAISYWSSCCNSIYHLFTRQSKSAEAKTEQPQPAQYEPPSLRV